MTVTGQSGAIAFSLTVDMSPGNVKLDLVSGTEFYTSGSVTLGQGVHNVRLLGVGALNATGNGAANGVTGNAGANVLTGLGGRDQLAGGGGTDRLVGGGGMDILAGGAGVGDVLKGGIGADTFVLMAGDGSDRVVDFSQVGGDRLRLDDALWAGQTLTASAVISGFASTASGHVILNFGDGDVLHLLGVTTLTGLAGTIDII